jgi:L-seryl-tRNA(Ser) seleniumtransferase
VPVDTLPSAGLALRATKRGRGIDKLAAALRRLPTPVLGRIVDEAVVLDLRCLEHERALLDALAALRDTRVNDASS